jgi:hypothetical protein
MDRMYSSMMFQYSELGSAIEDGKPTPPVGHPSEEGISLKCDRQKALLVLN